MSAKYEFIDAQKAQYAIVKMCRWLGVSTSGSTGGATGGPRRPRAAGSDSPPSSSGSTTTRTEHTGIAASTPRWSARASGAARSSCGRSCASWAWCRASLGRSDRRPPWPAAQCRRPTWSGVTSAPTRRARMRAAGLARPNLAGLALPRLGDRLLHQGMHWLRARRPHARRPGDRCACGSAARNHTLADGAIFHSDRGTQYTCEAFARAAAELDIFTGYTAWRRCRCATSMCTARGRTRRAPIRACSRLFMTASWTAKRRPFSATASTRATSLS